MRTNNNSAIIVDPRSNKGHAELLDFLDKQRMIGELEGEKYERFNAIIVRFHLKEALGLEGKESEFGYVEFLDFLNIQMLKGNLDKESYERFYTVAMNLIGAERRRERSWSILVRVCMPTLQNCSISTYK